MSIVSTTRSTKRGGNNRLGGAKPSGVCMNRKDLRSVREIALDNYDAEYMYLRENELTVFDADVKLDNLRVLDMSINDIGGAVNFLDKTPRLRHLYMTGNKIDTLMGIANFAALETLCLSDNAINSFEGLQNLPSLRVLSLNFNNISSFEGYPSLPNLHTLNLVGNPITEIPSYRSMAIAINCTDLVSIDGNPVQEEERVAVDHFQGKVVYCIREGFIVEGENMEEAADAFLLKHQREREKSKLLQLCAIRIASEDEESNVLTEGIPVTLSLCMQDIRPFAQRTTDIFHSRHLYPVIFKVSGEATEVFVVGSMNNWTDPIELERCEEEGEIYFHTTLYLPAGDYEYRYIVDGVEKVSETNRITSKYKQGFCNLYQVTELEAQEEDPDTILHIRWMRSTPSGVYQLIEGVNALSYTPAIMDIGSCLRVEALAYIDGEFSFLYFDISSPIVPAPPSCPHLEIKGSAVEGGVLKAFADYVGGVEGNSSLTWYRVSENGTATAVNLRDPWAGYKIGKDDLGCRIRVEFTPVRNDWVAGEPKSVETDPVVAGAPECESIRIVGNLAEGTTLEVDVQYTGGEEGNSVFQWLRKAGGADEYIPIEGENSTKYVPTLEDVGKCLAVEYTPINTAGVEGETCRCVLENPIEPMAPQMTNLHIVGDMKEDNTITIEYIYSGGHFGPHMIQWYRRDSKRHLIKIGQPNSAFLTLGNEEVGCSIEVSVTPVRSDGATGKSVHAKSSGHVAPADPKVQYFNIVGHPEMNQELSIEVAYSGGEEGASIVTWQIEDPETQVFHVVADGVSKYVVKKEDCGKMLKVTYTPVREDGRQGEAKSRIVEIAAAPESTPVAAHVDPVPQERAVVVEDAAEDIHPEEEDVPAFEEENAPAVEEAAEPEPKTENAVTPVEEEAEEEPAGNIKIDLNNKKDSDADSGASEL